MTPEEAAIERIEALRKLGKLSDTVDTIVAIEIAIEALKEIQQYRAIGTVEECKELASMVTTEKKNVLGQIVDEWKEYIEIGTVEECREAREKQKPKKPHRNYEKFSGLWCRCGWYLGKKQCLDIKYCPNCGQAIGTENLEGMEDERD